MEMLHHCEHCWPTEGKMFLDSLTLWQTNEVIGALGNAGFELIDGNERTTVA